MSPSTLIVLLIGTTIGAAIATLGAPFDVAFLTGSTAALAAAMGDKKEARRAA